MNAPMHPRRGAILLVVAGGSALIAALAMAFLVRMRSAAEETRLVADEAQARIMLLAACSYVLEGSRLGYDVDPDARPKPDGHIEAFGWIDVRDGAIGPRDQIGRQLWTAGAWPAVGATARCPMHAWTRPPYAISPTVAPNAIATRDPSSPDFGRPYLRHPDPLPMVANGWPGAVSDAAWDDFAAGDPRPRGGTTGLAWFRCHRESPARFVLTCGAGATQGFRSWLEVQAAGAEATFADDQALFDDLRANERLLWYRVEWSAAVTVNNYHSIDYHVGQSGHYYLIAVNGSLGNGDTRSQMRAPNPVGTIRWVERLAGEPAIW
ncbi:MAG TPA: hypothetical protein VEL07_18765 [Planctomycetota bacterium]|nr:hypothetical protein [Planctomycetota bacterium]